MLHLAARLLATYRSYRAEEPSRFGVGMCGRRAWRPPGTRARGRGRWRRRRNGRADAILSAAGTPVFFLDLRLVPRDGALGAWLAEPHDFHSLGAL